MVTTKTKTARKPAQKTAQKTAGKPATKTAVKSVPPKTAGPTSPTARKDVAAARSVVRAIDKQKLVRDSFTIPKSEYEGLTVLKQRLVGLERPTKKGELLRAGIAALALMADADLRAAVDRIPNLKTGRPKKD